MYISQVVGKLINRARELATHYQHEYMTPEHIVLAMCEVKTFQEVFENANGDVEVLKASLEAYVEAELEQHVDVEPIESFSLQQAFIKASERAQYSEKDVIELDHLLTGIMSLPESYAVYYVLEQGVSLRDLLFELCHNEDMTLEKMDAGHSAEEEEASEEDMTKQGIESISKYVTHLNELVREQLEPLIGREAILSRTVQVLCRKHKNNPIHVGEPGVGKTAITMGLAKLINEGKVPRVLQNATLFSLDLGAILAGTQYRGDFEKRLKKVLEIVKKQNNPIVYIDEIHNIVGAGALGAGSLDASNLLKPYLTEGSIKFIGATTFEEYKKYFGKDKGLARRFQIIEVEEPTVVETIEILKGLKNHYEAYHEVSYTDEAIEGAARLSQQYMNDRFLPDKAIDLLDEAGAYYRANEVEEAKKSRKQPLITLAIIEETLARICHIPKQKVERSEKEVLKQLDKHLAKQVFGQEEAVEQVVKSIKIARAGLKDAEKPVANLLFVGPTGVGKTELAKNLAEELGIKLIRFDMSEYTEKHTASKLIGSPPGYVGYEEGGLLTDAIRKTPHCVLLLDEIEKAHQDIFNMLLQVMDYATLTDNQGRKADFRNVILIMTSNAGAAKIGKKLVGFGERIMDDKAIDEALKKTFTPEFRNRLTKIIAFKHITEEMALAITKKQLDLFKEQLKSKNIVLSYTKKLVAYIAEQGISDEYGAREIARIVEGQIKPLLVDEILFGKLVQGGKCKVDIKGEAFTLSIVE